MAWKEWSVAFMVKNKPIKTNTMKKKHLLGMLFLSATLQAQEVPKTLDLQQAIDHALTHNRSVKNADLNILAATAQKWETTAAGLPQINGKIDYTNNIQRPFDVSGSGNRAAARLPS